MKPFAPVLSSLRSCLGPWCVRSVAMQTPCEAMSALVHEAEDLV